MAEFVDNFVMDSYGIMLNEEIVPTFWDHFVPKQTNMQAGFDQFCSAIDRLYADVKVLSPRLELLSQLRDVCKTNRSLFGEKTVTGLFLTMLRGTMHSQLPQGWEELVSQFYGQAFAVFYRAGGSQQTESCQCRVISSSFQKCITRVRELGLTDRLAGQVVLDMVQDKITSHVQETCK